MAKPAFEIGGNARLRLAALLFPRGVFALRQQGASRVTVLAGLAQADLRISSDGEYLLASINPVFEAPQFPPAGVTWRYMPIPSAILNALGPGFAFRIATSVSAIIIKPCGDTLPPNTPRLGGIALAD